MARKPKYTSSLLLWGECFQDAQTPHIDIGIQCVLGEPKNLIYVDIWEQSLC